MQAHNPKEPTQPPIIRQLLTKVTFWTPERVKTLLELHAQGVPMELIRDRLGAASVNSLLGKLFRLRNGNERRPDKPKAAHQPHIKRLRRLSSLPALMRHPAPAD